MFYFLLMFGCNGIRMEDSRKLWAMWEIFVLLFFLCYKGQGVASDIFSQIYQFAAYSNLCYELEVNMSMKLSTKFWNYKIICGFWSTLSGIIFNFWIFFMIFSICPAFLDFLAKFYIIILFSKIQNLNFKTYF